MNPPQFPFIPSVDVCVHRLVLVLFFGFLLTRGNTKKVLFLNDNPLFLLVMNPLHQARSNPAEFMPSDTAGAQPFATSAELRGGLAPRVSQSAALRVTRRKTGGENQQIKKPGWLFSGFKMRIKRCTRPQHYILKAVPPRWHSAAPAGQELAERDFLRKLGDVPGCLRSLLATDRMRCGFITTSQVIITQTHT